MIQSFIETTLLPLHTTREYGQIDRYIDRYIHGLGQHSAEKIESIFTARCCIDRGFLLLYSFYIGIMDGKQIDR